MLYAGSLVDVMENRIKPTFEKATGYSFQGFSAGSSALAQQIKGKIRQGDVFISASPTVNADLEGSANGNWVSWYITFATSPLVLGYNASSRFANDLRSKPWYRVVTEPGFLIGRTDPAVDPKGKLAVAALDTAATTYGAPALASIANSAAVVFPEETLIGRLQAGQLDAGFFYTSETAAASIPTIPLSGVDLKATYTITVLKQAPDEAGAEAFVDYLLSPAGQSMLTKQGFQAEQPYVTSGSGVPAGISSSISDQP